MGYNLRSRTPKKAQSTSSAYEESEEYETESVMDNVVDEHEDNEKECEADEEECRWPPSVDAPS